MQYPYRLDYEPTNLRMEKYVEKIHSYIEFNEKYLIWSFKSYGEKMIDSEDEKMGWERKIFNYNTMCLKASICGCMKDYISDLRLWEVSICPTGFTYDIKIYIKKESDAQYVFDSLKEYLLN